MESQAEHLLDENAPNTVIPWKLQRCPHDRSPQLGQQFSVAAGGWAPTGPQLPTRTGPSEAGLQHGTSTLREQYLDKPTQLTFHNDLRYCWLNAGLRSALWCFISRPAFCVADFGRGLRALSTFLTASTAEPVHVAQRSELTSLMASLAEEGRPRDVAEFTRELRCWLGSGLTSMQWERRFSCDAGSKELPIWLERMLTPHLGNTHRLLFEDDVQLPFFV